MPSSLEGAMAIRLGAALPERVATRIQLLLASVPDQDAALRFLERLRRAGQLKEPPENPSPTPERAADSEFLDIRIKLIQPE